MRNTFSTRKARFFTAFTAMLVGVLLCAVALAADALPYPFNTQTTDNVNMRSRASSSAVVLEKLKKGDSVTVTGASGSYFKVSYNGRTGYILKTYINTEKDAIVTPTPVPVETAYGYPYETVTTAKVAMRAERAKNGKVLRTLQTGASVTVTKVTGTYAWVTVDGVDGFIKTDYLRMKEVCSPTPVPTATPDPNGLYEYPILQKGSSGEAVGYLQEALYELGFYNGTRSCVFDDLTEKAVFDFQAKNGLHYTGYIEGSQQMMIYSGICINSEGKKVQVTIPSPLTEAAIVQKNTGTAVVKIQTRLNELGFYGNAITGIYDKETTAAVKAFQKKNGLPQTGACDITTRNLLYSNAAVNSAATATPKAVNVTPAPTAKVPATTVRRGSQGADAKLVQTRLKKLGYYTGKTDGKFGSASVAALKSFQEAMGLTVDGVAGSSTYVVLFSDSALAAGATPTPVPGMNGAAEEAAPGAAPAATPITPDNVVTVRVGAKGDAVSSVEARLLELGYAADPADGAFSENDAAALKDFQTRNALKADGVAGYATQVKLFSASAINASGAISGGAQAYDTNTILRKGMKGEAVVQLQQKLIELGYLTGTADGVYGRSTAAAVYNFQKDNNLTRDSVAGVTTLTLLYSAEASAAATATPAASATPAPNASLRKGDSSDAVKVLQQRLIDLGYLTGKADGKFGTATMQALFKFQRANGLKPDGIAGKATMSALTAANAVNAEGVTATPTPAPTPDPYASQAIKPTASMVQYANWYTTVKDMCRKYPYATVYDFSTGISWQVHMFSLGAHADSEPLTAADTAKMERAFGGNTWNPKAVWVVLADGTVYMASTHSMPHETQHRKDNNFDGHTCIHFPRTEAQVAAIGPYATSHQAAIDAGWAATQKMK